MFSQEKVELLHWRVQKYTTIGKYPSFYTLFNWEGIQKARILLVFSTYSTFLIFKAYKYQRKLPKNLCYKKVISIFALEKEVSETDYVRNFVVWPLRVYKRRFHLFGNAFFVYTGLKPIPYPYIPPDITIKLSFIFFMIFLLHNSWVPTAQQLLCGWRY